MTDPGAGASELAAEAKAEAEAAVRDHAETTIGPDDGPEVRVDAPNEPVPSDPAPEQDSDDEEGDRTGPGAPMP